ncbi:hypothetical protein CBL_13585 [Carabus blaptoides fortunei]
MVSVSVSVAWPVTTDSSPRAPYTSRRQDKTVVLCYRCCNLIYSPRDNVLAAHDASLDSTLLECATRAHYRPRVLPSHESLIQHVPEDSANPLTHVICNGKLLAVSGERYSAGKGELWVIFGDSFLNIISSVVTVLRSVRSANRVSGRLHRTPEGSVERRGCIEWNRVMTIQSIPLLYANIKDYADDQARGPFPYRLSDR